MIEFLSDTSAWIRNVNGAAEMRAELPAARARWQAQGIESYDIQVKGFVPRGGLLEAVLSVRHNRLAAVAARQNPWDESSPWVPVESQNWDLPFCSYRQLTIPGLFAMVEQDLQTADFSAEALAVSFDPVYGFVTRYDHRWGCRPGVFNPACSECCREYTFSHFRVPDRP